MEGINLIDIPIYIINFIVTFVLLYILLYKPVSKFLSARKEPIATSLKEAETAKSDAESILQEAKAELADASEKARRLSHEAIESAALNAELSAIKQRKRLTRLLSMHKSKWRPNERQHWNVPTLS